MSRRFKVIGVGRDTRRRRVRIYNAISERHARRMAASDDTEVDLVEEIQPLPPTARQIEVARELGVLSPEYESRESLKQMVLAAKSQKDSERMSPTQKQLDFARSLGIYSPETETKESISQLIADAVAKRDAHTPLTLTSSVQIGFAREPSVGDVTPKKPIRSSTASCSEHVCNIFQTIGTVVLVLGVLALWVSRGGGFFLIVVALVTFWFASKFDS